MRTELCLILRIQHGGSYCFSRVAPSNLIDIHSAKVEEEEAVSQSCQQALFSLQGSWWILLCHFLVRPIDNVCLIIKVGALFPMLSLLLSSEDKYSLLGISHNSWVLVIMSGGVKKEGYDLLMHRIIPLCTTLCHYVVIRLQSIFVFYLFVISTENWWKLFLLQLLSRI